MPAFVIPQGMLVRLIWQFNTVDYAVNVIGARNATPNPVNLALANTLDNAFKARFTSSGLRALCAAPFQLKRTTVRDISIANQPEFVSTNTGQFGTGAGSMLPGNVSYCVTLRTALAGKSYRGRFYVCGMVASQSDANGNPVSGLLTAAAAFVNGLGTDLTTSGFTMGVISRHLSTVTPMTAAEPRNTTFSTQRRRLIAGI